ncbi:major facilitator superfamily domain-containing protein [Xylogone sp. PMI_703]|nr:major facilitator superfamily domain-containing protein [Xylogone sp. PMI_703]
MLHKRFKTLKDLDETEGTVQLLDASQQHQHLAGTSIVLIPQPSNDPNDPLRWPAWKKNMAFAAVCFFSFINNFNIDGPSAGFVEIAMVFNVSLTKTSGLLSWIVLTLGLANIFWVPTSAYIGKRPTFLIAMAIEVAATAWSAKATSFNSLLASSVVAAFGGGASEALSAAVINDLFFLHERGTRMGYYIVSIAWGSAVGPLVGGYIIQRLGWQWQKWVSLIGLSVNLVWFIFFFPETRFNCIMPATKEKTSEVSDMQGATLSDNSSGDPKTSEVQDIEIREEHNYSKSKSYIAQLNPWSGIDTQVSYLSLVLRPIPLVIYPACIYALLAYSICLAPTVMVSILSSPLLSQPPYNFGLGAVGLINASAMIGHLVGAIGGGWLSDKYVKWRAERKNGVFEPESRLTLILPLAICVVVGMLMFGFGAGQQLGWPVIFVSFGFTSVGLTGIAGITMNYAMECYYPVSSECLEVINSLKNVVAFGFVYATVPWNEAQGYEKEFGEMTVVFVFIIGMAIPLYAFGARIRHYTSSKWRLISW